MDNLKRALKKAKPGGDAVPVLNKDGRIIGFCGRGGWVGIEKPVSTFPPGAGLTKCLKAAEKYKRPHSSTE